MSQKDAQPVQPVETVEFVPLLNFENDYEILNIHPFTIRKKSNHRILKECNNGNGYVSVSLSEKTYLKHRIIALQFIPNDDPEVKTEVDHINQIRNDNRIENLRWCTHAENSLNKSHYKRQKYEYTDKLDTTNLITIENYNGDDYDRYYFDKSVQKLYVYTRRKYKVVNPSTNGKMLLVTLIDVNGKNHTVSYNKLIRQLNEIE